MEYTIGTKVFDGWEITRLLGEGSYGRVFAIEKTDFGFTTRAALKLIQIPRSPAEIREALSEGMDEKSITTYFEEIVERFVREIAVMSQLKGHPNVVSCENYKVEPHPGTIGWDILIKMELLTSLQDYMLDHPLQEKDVLRLAEDLCRALVFIQKQGLIHRDIKPANIFVDQLGQFKLGDFGVARTAEKTLGGMSKQGTENYMAPEVYHGKPYGASVDIYSLGLMLYRLTNSNRLPFYPPAPQRIGLADRENALISRMRGDPFPPPRDASPEFAAIILKACAHNPRERYRSAGEMLEALSRCKGSADSMDVGMDSSSNRSADDDNGTESIFGGRSPSSNRHADDDNGTVNIFGGGSSSSNRHADDDNGTVNIFGGGSSSFDRRDDDEGDSTVNIFGGGSPSSNRHDDDDGESTVNIFGGGKAVPDEAEAAGTSSRDQAMLAFWKENLIKLWGHQMADLPSSWTNNMPNAKWKPYFAPGIPLQICSNAIFNITESRVKKEDILAILDCTFDTRIPCGRGIVITRDKMYINLLAENVDPMRFPPAVLIFDRLKRVWSGVLKGSLFRKFPGLFWENVDGASYSFGVNMCQFVDYDMLAQLLNSEEWKACMKLKN